MASIAKLAHFPVQQDVNGLFSNFNELSPHLIEVWTAFSSPAPITEPNCSPDGLCLCVTARVQATVLSSLHLPFLKQLTLVGKERNHINADERSEENQQRRSDIADRARAKPFFQY